MQSHLSQKNEINSPRLREIVEKRRRQTRLKRIAISAIVVVLLSVCIFIIKRPALQIYDVDVLGAEVVDTRAVQQAMVTDISGHILFVIPRTSRFFYPKKKIMTDLRAQFPRIKTLSVKLSGRTLTATMTEHTIDYLWCGVDTAVNPDCYSVDTDGSIFSEAPDFSGTIYFRFFTPVSGDPINGVVLPDTELANVISFVHALKTAGFPAKAFALKPDGTREFFLSGDFSGNKQVIILGPETDFTKATTNLLSALAVQPLKKDMATKQSKLDYIDLRYTDKVYYKFEQ